MRYTGKLVSRVRIPLAPDFLYRIRDIGAECKLPWSRANAAFAPQTQRRPNDVWMRCDLHRCVGSHPGRLHNCNALGALSERRPAIDGVQVAVVEPRDVAEGGAP